MAFASSPLSAGPVLEAAEREHIDNLRSKVEHLICKTPQDQDVWLELDETTKVAKIVLKSGAKNALSGRMLSKLTQVIDQVYELCSPRGVKGSSLASNGSAESESETATVIVARPEAGTETELGQHTREVKKNETTTKDVSDNKWLQQNQLEEARCKGVLIQGFGETFCSGSDLISARETANQQAGFELAQIMQYNLMRLQLLPVVSCAFIEGFALGGGAELAMGADFRLMSPNAKLGFVHAKIGVVVGFGGGSRLVELLGHSKALELLSSARIVDADQAFRLGLTNGTVSNEREAMDFMTSHTIGSSGTIRALKSMVNCARFKALHEALAVEGRLFASTWGKEAHLRALQSNIKHNDKATKNSASNGTQNTAATNNSNSNIDRTNDNK